MVIIEISEQEKREARGWRIKKCWFDNFEMLKKAFNIWLDKKEREVDEVANS
jgi:hypothetical protein